MQPFLKIRMGFGLVATTVLLACSSCGEEASTSEDVTVSIAPEEGYFEGLETFDEHSPVDEKGRYYKAYEVRGLPGYKASATASSFHFRPVIEFYEGDKQVAKTEGEEYRTREQEPRAYGEASVLQAWEGKGPYRIIIHTAKKGEKGEFLMRYDPHPFN